MKNFHKLQADNQCPSASNQRIKQGFFERLVGYERIEYLRDLAGIKDRLYEDAPFRVLVRGTAARPTYIPSQADHRIVDCTGIPADSHDLFWMRVYIGKIERCPECGHALQAYEYEALVKTFHQFYNEQQQAAKDEDVEVKEILAKMEENRFINLDGSRIIHGRRNRPPAPCNSSPNKKIGE
jgi:hypothetical protein